MNKYGEMDNLELLSYREALELRDMYLDSIEFDQKAKGYKDPKFPSVIINIK